MCTHMYTLVIMHVLAIGMHSVHKVARDATAARCQFRMSIILCRELGSILHSYSPDLVVGSLALVHIPRPLPAFQCFSA